MNGNCFNQNGPQNIMKLEVTVIYYYLDSKYPCINSFHHGNGYFNLKTEGSDPTYTVQAQNILPYSSILQSSNELQRPGHHLQNCPPMNVSRPY